MPEHFPFYEFRGAPYELGRAHGETLAPAVRRQAAEAIELAARSGQSREAALAWSLEQLPRIERLGPHWIDELRGLAEGAGISLAEAVAIQVRPGSGRMAGGCTSIAALDEATTDGRPLGAQNRDLAFGFRPRMVVTLLRPTGRTPLLLHSVPGELAGTGLNGQGLALFANSLWAKAGRTWMGIPILRRALLETPDAPAAAELARSMDGAAVGSFLLVDAAGQMRNLENMPEGVVVTARDRGVYAHTNHCLDARQQTFEVLPLQAPGSPGRCQTMDAALSAAAGSIDVETIKGLLAIHEPAGEMICRHGQAPGETETAATSVVEPAMRKLHLSYGPPCQGNFVTYTLTPSAS